MFVALREIRASRGRFGLMAGVVAMITVLLVILTALTQGLGKQSTSAVEDLPAARVVVAPTDGKATYAESQLTDAQLAAWRDADGVQSDVLGIGHARLEHDGGAQTVALFATDRVAVAGGAVVLPADSATALGVAVGGTVTIGGRELTVAGVEETRWYSHSPVAWVAPDTFQAVTHQAPRTALLVANPLAEDTARTLDASAGTVSATPGGSLTWLPGYQSEHGSLLLIQAFLYGISALVVLAFVSIWTVQRTRDLAVVRALGGSRSYVVRDALGQAALLLSAGVLLGAAIAWAALLGLGRVAPVLSGVTTFALPIAGILALGLAGSWFATRRVASVDPMLALGGN